MITAPKALQCGEEEDEGSGLDPEGDHADPYVRKEVDRGFEKIGRGPGREQRE